MNKQLNSLDTKKPERAYVYCGFSQPDHYILGQAARQKTPPYNTGKVKIGLAYQPPVNQDYSVHAERLQSALLDKRTHTERRADTAADLALYVVAAIGLTVVFLTL